MLAIVVSRADSASEHVGEHLLDLADWTEQTDGSRSDGDGGGTVYRTADVELREFDDLHLEIEDVGEAFGTVEDGPDREFDLLVFASRHAGETGALLTAHHTGNFGPAEFGGTDGDLARACPWAHKRVLEALREHAPPEYDVGMEATHHGPSSVGIPSMFVELGSNETYWKDPDGASAVAQAILDLRDVDPDTPRGSEDSNDYLGVLRRHLVGFGGGHYAPRFERITRETEWAIGHLAADWALEDMGDTHENPDVVEQAFVESAATMAVVEGDAADVEAVVEDLGYRVVSETWVRETDEVPLELVDTLEDALCSVDDGLRFSETVEDAAETFDVVSLPDELLAAAQGIDSDRTRDAIERQTLAFETIENGTRAKGRAAVADATDRERLIDDLADVLAESYETVERTDTAVVARQQEFDPERARTLGITEGPKYGALASGEAVEHNGRTIDPEAVHVERERRFPVTEP